MNDLATTKKNFQRGLKSIANPWLFPIDQKYVDGLSKLSESASTHSQIVTLSLMRPPQQTLSYTGMYPWKGKPEDHFCLDFDASPLGWYFMYGHGKTLRFTFMVFHIGVDPSAHGLQLYSVVGGYDTGKGWLPIPQNGGPATYSCNKNGVIFSYMDTHSGVAASFNGKPGGALTGSFSMFKEKSFKFTITPTQGGQYNGEDGCIPGCFGGLGTLYWSYTNPKCTMTYGGRTDTGKGWFDRQTILGGIPRGTINQLLYSFLISGAPPGSISWLWLIIQLTNSNTQYMFFPVIKQKQLPLKVGDTLTAICNKYQDGKASYKIPCKIKVLTTTSVAAPGGGYTMTFPTSYSITVEQQTYILSTSASNDKPDVVYMPSGSFNWEGPGIVKNSKGERVGSGFLEANGLLPDSAARKVNLLQFPGSSLPDQAPLSRRAVFIAVALLTLGIILVTGIFVLVMSLIVHLAQRRSMNSSL